MPRIETEFVGSQVGIMSQSWKEPEEIIHSASCFRTVNSEHLQGNYGCQGKVRPIQNVIKGFRALILLPVRHFPPLPHLDSVPLL